jgi:hypothetical protein
MGKGGGGGRSKNKARRSTGSLPRGIPHKKGGGVGSSSFSSSGGGGGNPFDFARTKNSASRVKHPVHNKLVPGAQRGGVGVVAGNSKLAESLARRQKHLSRQMANAGKANSFVDRRIGEAATRKNDDHDGPDVMLRRLVQERVRRSKKLAKYSLGDDGDGGDGGLTHRGERIDENYTGAPVDHDDVLLSDDDEENLDRVDTMLHFGGGKFDSDNARERGAYGGGGGGGRGGEGGGGTDDMGRAYRSRREELEDRIRMKKMAKAEKMKRKEDQGELPPLFLARSPPASASLLFARPFFPRGN